MADLAGRLNIELKRREDGVAARIDSSRPVAASRVFVGKTVEETTSSLPALFSICAAAQACACVSACEAAQGLAPSPAVIRLRRLLLDAETVKEHLWRVLLDWPRFLDRPPRAKAMQVVMGAYAGLRAALAAGADPIRPGADATAPDLPAATVILDQLARLSEEFIHGGDTADWLQGVQTPGDLSAWATNTDTDAACLVREVRARGWSAAGRNAVTSLPHLSFPDLAPLLTGADAEQFVTEPGWQGEPKESSPFTRRLDQPLVSALTEEFGNGLLPRLAAQLVELAALHRDLQAGLMRLDSPTEPLAEGVVGGVGIAQVPAARGLLVHRVAVDNGRILDYRILAPTEWNFHPRGVVAQGLSALPSSDASTLQRLASLFVTAVDPCVEYHISAS